MRPTTACRRRRIAPAVNFCVVGRARLTQSVSLRSRIMRTITTLVFLVAQVCCVASSDTNVIAMSDWSPPLDGLRVRMVVGHGRGANFGGPWPETQFYLEFKNVTGSDLEFYFDPLKGLHAQLEDAKGKTVSPGGAGSGGGAGASWITLPYDSIIRLRANMYGYGEKPGEGLNLTLYPPQAWQIRPGDTNAYFLSGEFTVTKPTNSLPRDTHTNRGVWSGTLELPKMRIVAPMP
jgi:hypothetical protein